ncbi:MAG: hypothetical protein QXF35_00420 [Candidatus Bilamarchaeaceae archaeon]
MAIVGERIREISGRKQKSEQIKGLNMSISIDDVRVNDKNIEIDYAYAANYEEGVGNITIKGTILAVEDSVQAKKINEEWKKNKKLPEDYTTTILSAINYSGSANGTLIARVLNLAAPLIPPRIELSKPSK